VVWLYRIWPQVIDAMICQPATVVNGIARASGFFGAANHAVRTTQDRPEKSVI